jgi:hypothetical protein
MTKFDPHTYMLNGGWGWDSVEATALTGTSEVDDEILREMYGEDAGEDAAWELYQHCCQLVAERAAAQD